MSVFEDFMIGHEVKRNEDLERLEASNRELLERLEMLHRVFLQRNLSHDDMQEANLAWIAIRKSKGELL